MDPARLWRVLCFRKADAKSHLAVHNPAALTLLPPVSQSQAGGPSQLDQNRQLPHLPFLCPCLVRLFIANYSPCMTFMVVQCLYKHDKSITSKCTGKQNGLIREKPPIGGFPISSLLILGNGGNSHLSLVSKEI